MSETLKDIIINNDDLYLISVNKKDRLDRCTWTFEVLDSNSRLAGVVDHFSNYKYQTVWLRRNNHFFMAYKFNFDDGFEYFVDPHKAIHRNTITKYVNNLVEYSVYSNDISKTKNEPSFKVTQREMQAHKIDNFLDLCYYYKDYSAIGTGYTRNIRNLVVMDIDVDCTKPDNQQEINNLLIKFANCDSLPNFYIYNYESKHVQLQWLIQNFPYKEVSQESIDKVVNDLTNDTHKNKEIKLFGTDFTEIKELGIDYRRFTLALCDIVKKRKFGDKNYTFWKAKNPMSALERYYNLELKMPYLENGEIKYMSQDEMNDIFSTKESRQSYFENAPTIVNLYQKTKNLMDPFVQKVSEKKVKKIIDGSDIIEQKSDKTIEKTEDGYGKSRNTFVLNCTRYTTWEIAKEKGFRNPENIKALKSSEFNMFKSEVKMIVRQKFNLENEKYNGFWPDTTNISVYTNDEFDKTFDKSFQFAIQYINISSYSNEHRKRSQESRCIKKDMRLLIVDYIRNKKEMSRDELLKETNKFLEKCGHKHISLSSLKRYISDSKKLSDDDRKLMYEKWKAEYDHRQQQFINAIEHNKHQKIIDTCKKRCDYVSMNGINIL